MNRPRTSVYIATSQDGFIARPNGDIDWLNDPSLALLDEDYGYQTFMDSVDTLVMGRLTFEKVLSFGEWPYSAKRVVVLSSTNPTVPDALRDRVSVLSEPPGAVLDYVAKMGGQHVYLYGGQTIQRFLREKYVDELILTRLPILLGQGIPLFGPLREDVHLRHMETRTFSNGFIKSRFSLSAQ